MKKPQKTSQLFVSEEEKTAIPFILKYDLLRRPDFLEAFHSECCKPKKASAAAELSHGTREVILCLCESYLTSLQIVITDISAILPLSDSTVRRSLFTLEKRGVVEKLPDKNDHRRKIVSLTKPCKNILKNYVNKCFEDFKELIQHHDKQEREKAEIHNRAILEHSLDAIITIDREGRIVSFNPSAELIFGYQASQVIGQQMAELIIPPTLRKRHNEAFRRRRMKEKGVLYGKRINTIALRADGQEIDIELTMMATKEGKTEHFTAFIRDITEFKQTDKELEESRKMYRSLVEYQSQLVCQFLPDTTLTFVNDSYARFFDKTPKELIGNRFADFLSDEVKKETLHFFASFTPEHPIHKKEQKTVGADGNVYWHIWDNYAFFDDFGNVVLFQGVGTDITERKRTESTLQKSEERLEEASRIAHLGYWIWDEVTDKQIDCSDGYARIYETSKEHILSLKDGKTNSIHVHPDDSRMLKRVFQNFLENKKSYDVEYRNTHPDGTWRYIREIGKPIIDEQGKLVRSFGIIQDITLQKLTEEKLRKSEEKYRAYVENAPEGIFVADQNGNYVDVNKVACELLGYARKQLLSMSVTDITPPELLPKVIKEFEELKQTGSLQTEHLFRKNDGSDIELSLKAVLLPNGNVLGFCTDITKRKMAEKNLRKNEERFKRLFENAPLGYQSLNIDGEFIEINPAWLDMFGYAREEVIGHLFQDFLIDEGFVEKNLPRFMEAGEIQLPTSKMRCKDGSEKIIHIEGRIGCDEEENFLQTHCILTDVTERKQAEEKIKASLAEKEVLIREIHHRVKNNLQVMSSMLEMQERRATNKAVKEALQDSKDRVRVMALVYQNLYETSEKEGINLKQYLELIVRDLAAIHGVGEKDISVLFDADEVNASIDVAIPSCHIVSELMSNSFKYAFPDDRKGMITISLHDLGAGSFEIDYADDGVGLPNDFDLKTDAGLGLELVQTYIQGRGWELSYDSQHGAHFNVKCKGK